MKKIVCMIVTLILLAITSVGVAYEGEILFRGIPWSSNVPDVVSKLPPYLISSGFEWECRVPIWGSVKFEYEKLNNGEYPIVGYYGGIQVAGYDVNTVSFGFLFTIGSDGQIYRTEDKLSLYSATYDLKVADVESAVSDLINKLTNLYGESQSDTIDYAERIIHRTIWYGDNNTGVCLLYSEHDISISYGITNQEYIIELDDALAKEEKNRAVDNTDGL